MRLTTDWETLAATLPDFNFTDIRTLIGDNSDLYSRMLAQFFHDYSHESVEIIYLLGVKKISDAEKLLHRLKGVSGNLGAVALQQASEALDAELKQGKYSEQVFDIWQMRLIKTLNDVKTTIEQTGALLDHKPAGELKTFTSIMTEIEEKLNRNAFIDLWKIKELQSFIHPAEIELYGRLVRFITIQDYPKARSTLKTLTYVANAAN